MNRGTNIAVLALVAALTIVVERSFLGSGFVDEMPLSGSLEGEVLSVDPPSKDGGNSLSRTARVKLGSGEIVRATVGGCVVFPGQTTRLSRHGGGSSATYIITENGRNDS